MDPNLRPETDEERREALFRTLDRLRTAAGIRDPDVDIVSRSRPGTAPARLVGTTSRFRIVVAEDLLDVPDEARAWHLARVLSWWTTPGARWRHRLLVLLVAAVALVGAGGVAAALAGRLPPLVLVLGGLVLTLVVAFCVHRLLAGRRRALDEGGIDLLRAAGYDPATAQRAARGDDPRPGRP